jgi:Leucine-rich repeat (LRR) protein
VDLNISEGYLKIILSDLVETYGAALFRSSITMTVLDVIMENVPDPTALDLSDNNISALDSLIVLAVKAPNLRIFHSARNQASFCIQSTLLHVCFCFVLKHCNVSFCFLFT